MWQVWVDGRLFTTCRDKWAAELVLEWMDLTYPNADKEVKLCLIN